MNVSCLHAVMKAAQVCLDAVRDVVSRMTGQMVYVSCQLCYLSVLAWRKYVFAHGRRYNAPQGRSAFAKG